MRRRILRRQAWETLSARQQLGRSNQRRVIRDLRRRDQRLASHWEDVWVRAAAIAPSAAPEMDAVWDLPAGDGSHRSPSVWCLQFVLRPGTASHDFAHTGRMVADAIGRQMVVIEQRLADSSHQAVLRHIDDGSAELVAPLALRYGDQQPAAEVDLTHFWVLHELVDMGSEPHLNPALGAAARGLAIRFATHKALAEAGLAPALILGCRDLSRTASAPVAAVILDTLTDPFDVAERSSRLRDDLRCDWLRVSHAPNDNAAGIVFGTAPRSAAISEACAIMLQTARLGTHLRPFGDLAR